MNRSVASVPTLRIDPFFDDEAENFSPDSAPGVKKFAPFYSDPQQEKMTDGRSVLQYVPANIRGVKGVVIPHATPGGVPEGIEPNAIDDIEVHIDPQLPGQSAVFTLGQMKESIMKQSIAEATKLVPDGRTLARRRRRSSAAYRLAAEHIEQGDVPETEEEVAAASPVAVPTRRVTAQPRAVQSLLQPAPQPGPAAGQPVSFGSPPLPRAKQASRGGMLSSFAHATADAPQAQVAPPQPAAVANLLPTREVLFELEHFGEQTAWYHDVVYQTAENRIMLVYDLRCQHATKWFPPRPTSSSNPLPRMAMRETGKAAVCLVSHSGFQYVYDGKEVCLLDVHEVGELPPEE